MIKKLKKSKTRSYKDMTLNGYPIRIYKDKVVVLNINKIQYEEFKPISIQLAQYLMDELFITKDEIQVEVSLKF